ncbi:inositol hexakisphosphate and diphosphoinositol-pentakisphosphate kinase [Caerostris extrusa]|uniref:Inositol hexakisphosphate and diphosphoinositol-pentakisphosphate kinase n=1 Tax=Caerostris extrusa TaxID=172846 RepID=A0AAV4RFP5_CAEEX|nr:inositol hexakisphosphate and diphosphoinositol-pentakisphosphate kinase [Caerostris extrusa]
MRADCQNGNLFPQHPPDRVKIFFSSPMYSHGVSSPERHVRTRLYFTSESHIHSLLTVLRYGGLLDLPEKCLLCSCLPEDSQDEQWRRAMEYVSAVSELNYMTQVVIMLYEDPTKDVCSEERFHVELHFSPGVVCCVQKNLPPGPGFRPQSRSGPKDRPSCPPSLCLTASGGYDCEKQTPRIDEEDDDLTLEDEMNCASDPDSPTLFEESEEKKLILGRNKASEPIPIQRASPKVSCSLPHKPCVAVRSGSDAHRPRSLDSESSKAAKPDKGSPHTQSLEDVSLNNKTAGQQREPFQHRHSIPNQLSSYLRMCSAADLPKVYGSANSLFSTAVISGSSSAPELKDAGPRRKGCLEPPSRELRPYALVVAVGEIHFERPVSASAQHPPPGDSAQRPLPAPAGLLPGAHDLLLLPRGPAVPGPPALPALAARRLTLRKRSLEWAPLVRVEQRALLPQFLHAGHLGPVARPGGRSPRLPQQPALPARPPVPQQQPLRVEDPRNLISSCVPARYSALILDIQFLNTLS